MCHSTCSDDDITFLPAIHVHVFKKKIFPTRNHMPIGTGVFPIGFKSFNYNEELPFNLF